MVVRRALGVFSLAEAEDRSLLRDSKAPTAAAGQQGMAEQYHGDNGKQAPQV